MTLRVNKQLRLKKAVCVALPIAQICIVGAVAEARTFVVSVPLSSQLAAVRPTISTSKLQLLRDLLKDTPETYIPVATFDAIPLPSLPVDADVFKGGMVSVPLATQIAEVQVNKPSVAPTVVQEFQTFSVSIPVSTQLAAAAASKKVNSDVPIPHGPADGKISTAIVATLFPGTSGISTTTNGAFHGTDLESDYSSTQQAQGDFGRAGNFSLSSGGQSLTVGNSIVEGLSSHPGMRFASTQLGNNITTGFGIYQMGEFGTRSSIVPALDFHFKASPGDTLIGAIGADSSWSIQQEVTKGPWSFETDASRQPNYGIDQGFVVTRSIGSSTTVYDRMAKISENDGSLRSMGLVQQLKPAVITYDTYSLSQQDLKMRQDMLGVYFPSRRQTLTAEFRSGDVETLSDNPTSQKQKDLVVSYYSRVSGNTTLSGSDELIFEYTGGKYNKNTISLGIDHNFGYRLAVHTLFWQNPFSDNLNISGSVGYRVDREWQVSVLFGPPQNEYFTDGPHTALGLQVVRDINTQWTASGAVTGAVTLDDGDLPKTLGVCVDDGSPVHCDRTGRFRIRHIDSGEHIVAIDPTSLPADLSPDVMQRSVTVKNGHTAQAFFHLQRVGSVSGVVYALADQFGHTDPTAMTDILITDGSSQSTTSGVDGSFSLRNLPLGHYNLSIDERSLPPNYVVEAPKSVTINIADGVQLPAVHFTISPQIKSVDFGTSPSNPVATAPHP